MTASPGLLETVRQLTALADIRGNPFETVAWRRAAERIESMAAADVARLAQQARGNQLRDLDFFPPALLPKFLETLIDGAAALAAARSALPWLIRRLLDLALVDIDGAGRLVRHGIVTFADLTSALEDGPLPGELSGMTPNLQTAILTIADERPPLTLGRAVDLLETAARLVADACPDLEELTPAGDARRVEPVVASLVMVAHAVDPVAAIDALERVATLRVFHRTNRRAVVGLQQAEIDIHVAAADEFGTSLYLATGSRAHLAAMRQRQPARRLSRRETDVYAHAGLSWIPPELRRDGTEIDAAAAGSLPALVTREDIRGDLHLHTTYSDGRDTLADMVRAAALLGYEYIAITDHSERAGASRTLSRDALARQRDELDALRPRYPQLTILHGVEVDIMADGSLDFDDEVLAELDIVLASLHDSRGHDPARLTSRCLAAIHHPLVHVITHPANRLVGRSAGYDLDFPRVYAAAAATGTALEIDGAPSHLDLDGDRAREAVAAGATVTIDSDCHVARLLERQMRLGVGTARRGWVEPRHVLNVRPIDEVRAFLRAKRQAQP